VTARRVEPQYMAMQGEYRKPKLDTPATDAAGGGRASRRPETDTISADVAV
jgi:hypothetical protein